MKAILACTPDGGIGNKGGLPWPKIKEDFEYFQSQTIGSTVVMGSKTWISLGEKPLKDRLNIVMSRSGTRSYGKRSTPDNVDLWIIGGAEIYDYYKDQIDEYHVTFVLSDCECDTFINLKELFGDKFKLIENKYLTDNACVFIYKRIA